MSSQKNEETIQVLDIETNFENDRINTKDSSSQDEARLSTTSSEASNQAQDGDKNTQELSNKSTKLQINGIPTEKNDAKLAAEIEDEIEKAIQARKVCIRNECIRSKKRVDLGSCRIDDLDALTISLYLNEQHHSIELLHLGANLLSDEGLINILSGLQWHTNLKELYLGNNYFTEVGISALVDALPLFTCLETLSLGNTGMTDDNAVALSYILMDFPKLRNLYLNSNKIGDSAMIALGILVASNQLKCSTLHLGENQFTSKGLIPFLKAFQKNTTIKQLYLNDVLLQNDAVKALAKGLIKNTYLQELNIGNCGIDDESITLMRNFLMFNTRVKSVHLWGNRITNQGALTLLSILECHNHQITNMTLSDNFIDDQDLIEDIKAYLKQNNLGPKSHLPINKKSNNRVSSAATHNAINSNEQENNHGDGKSNQPPSAEKKDQSENEKTS